MAHKLLLADDSHTIQRVVELTFASEDIDVVTVGDGAQAIEAIERDEPDIVLADVSMPGKNGYDVASFVRSGSARSGIPVVLLTGAFEPLDEERCDAIGRHEVLVKPFEPREVIGKVRELLDLPAAGAREASTDAAAPPQPATAATGEDAADETAPESESQAAEGVASEEVPSADAPAEADPRDASAAVDARVEEKAAERSPAGVSDPPPVPAAADPASTSEDVDPSSPAADADPADPAASLPEQAVVDRAAAPSAGEATPEGAGRTPPAGAGGSVLAQSFVTFLAVERGAAPPGLPAPNTGADSGGAAPPLPKAVMDDLVDRVVERLTDTVLRDTVAEVVSRIAERLAREEITRVPPGGE